VGACLLTDWQSDLSNYFEPDVEVATYRNSRELVERARHLLNSPLEREEIARAGQRRTLRDHTFRRRAAVLEAILRDHL
jgi:spore maturation protein CgeB